MTSAQPRLSRVSTGLAIAFALAAAPAAAAEAIAGYLKFDDIKGESQARSGHGGPIIVESWSFGASQAVGDRGLGSWSKAEGLGVNMGQSDSRAGETVTVDKDEKITIHGGRTEGDTDRPVVIGSLPNPPKATVGGSQSLSVGANRSAPMQYNPKEFTVSKPVNWATAAPASTGRGSLRAVVPAGNCRAGARYPSAELGAGGRVYRMRNVVVSACSAAPSANNVAMEQVTLSYEGVSR